MEDEVLDRGVAVIHDGFGKDAADVDFGGNGG
jgi:hypothetical protein